MRLGYKLAVTKRNVFLLLFFFLNFVNCINKKSVIFKNSTQHVVFVNLIRSGGLFVTTANHLLVASKYSFFIK